ncbi:hypothetical protein I4U23_011794 [Adineta vaga]|nr:hypothetical protein I4U23_011794 [Adineta vaga]
MTTTSNILSLNSTTFLHECRICGDYAEHSNYGTMTCSACKMFFRRNGKKGQELFKCDFNNNCHINIQTRHLCSACRLRKCFVNGMQIELIRCSLSKQNKMKIIPSTPIVISNILIPTVNLLQSDQSTLSIDQWNHISNLIHCYDENGPLSIAQTFVIEQNSLPVRLRYKSDAVTELYTSIYTEIQQRHGKNKDFLSLCLQDQCTLVHKTVKNVSSIAGLVVLHYTNLLYDPLFLHMNEIIFGLCVTKGLVGMKNTLDDDMTFVKLLIAILSFSTTDYTNFSVSIDENFVNRKTILRIQDTYIELLWRYMVYKHSHQHAVFRFSQALRCVFYSLNCIAEVDAVEEYQVLISTIVEQTEQTIIISDN